MSETPTPSLEEATRSLTAPGQTFEMEEVAVRGVPTRVWKNCPANLGVILEMSRGHGDLDYLVYEDERTSYEAHFRAASTIARRLHDRFGVVKGDRIAIAMRNLPEWAMAFWGAAAGGGGTTSVRSSWVTTTARRSGSSARKGARRSRRAASTKATAVPESARP